MRYRIELMMIALGAAPLLLVEACGDLKKGAGCHYVYLMPDGASCSSYVETTYGIGRRFIDCSNHREYINPSSYGPQEVCNGR